MKVKMCICAKFCKQNKILASKMQHLKQKKTFVFTLQETTLLQGIIEAVHRLQNSVDYYYYY